MSQEGLERYAAERRQGEAIAEEGLERVWGWSTPAGRERADRRARFLIRAGRLGPGVRCLELGCGTGEFTARLVESGCELHAVELSEATAAEARRRLGGRAAIHIGNIETGDGVPSGPFDAIVGVSVLHHVDVGACLARTFPLLREQGRFAFAEPNMANPQVWLERHVGAVGRLRHVTPHETAFHAAELRALFEEAGLVVDVCEPFDFLHPETPPALIGAVRRLTRYLEASPLRRIAGSVRIAGFRPKTTGVASANATKT